MFKDVLEEWYLEWNVPIWPGRILRPGPGLTQIISGNDTIKIFAVITARIAETMLYRQN